MQAPVLPKRLIGRVSALLGGKIILQPHRRETQPLMPRSWDRRGGLPPLLVLLATRFAQPAHPALGPRDDPLDVKSVRRRFGRALLRPGLLRRHLVVLVTLALELAHEPLPPARLGLKLGRQLISARVAVLLVLGLIGRDCLSDDLPCDPVIVNVRVTGRVRRQLRAINCDHPRRDQTRARAQLQN